MEIQEETLQDLEIGGNIRQRLYADKVKGTLKYIVKECKIVKTEYGYRADYVIADDFAEWNITSWDLVSQQKFKAMDLVGKNIQLEPVEINQRMKFKLTVLD